MKKFIVIGLFLISVVFGAMGVQADTIKDTDGNTVSSENTYYVRIKPLTSGIPDYYWGTPQQTSYDWTYLSNIPEATPTFWYKFEPNGSAYKIYSVNTAYLRYYNHNIFYPNGGVYSGARSGSINWTFTSVGNNTYSFKADDGNIYARISGDTADLTTAIGSAGYNYYNFNVQFVKVK